MLRFCSILTSMIIKRSGQSPNLWGPSKVQISLHGYCYLRQGEEGDKISGPLPPLTQMVFPARVRKSGSHHGDHPPNHHQCKHKLKHFCQSRDKNKIPILIKVILAIMEITIMSLENQTRPSALGMSLILLE